MKNNGWIPRELDEIQAALIERKRRLAGTQDRLSHEAFQALGDSSPLPQHLADIGTETFEQDKDLGLAERAGVEIAEIDQALERLEEGTYGICEECGMAIPRERLEAIPDAALCTRCKAKHEAA